MSKLGLLALLTVCGASSFGDGQGGGRIYFRKPIQVDGTGEEVTPPAQTITSLSQITGYDRWSSQVQAEAERQRRASVETPQPHFIGTADIANTPPLRVQTTTTTYTPPVQTHPVYIPPVPVQTATTTTTTTANQAPPPEIDPGRARSRNAFIPVHIRHPPRGEGDGGNALRPRPTAKEPDNKKQRR